MQAPTFGDWVRGNRKRLGWSQQRLATETGMDRAHISKIESGAIALPAAETRARFHAVFLTTDGELERLGVVPRYDEWGRLLAPPDVARGDEPEGNQGDDPDSVRELIALLRRVRLTGDREAALRGMFEMWLRRDQTAEVPDPAMRREVG